MEFTLFKEEKEFPHALEDLLTNERVRNFLLQADSLNCKGCGKEFDSRNLEVWMYDHDGGWDVGLEKRQWLSIFCEHCGYHTSFSKLKVGRV